MSASFKFEQEPDEDYFALSTPTMGSARRSQTRSQATPGPSVPQRPSPRVRNEVDNSSVVTDHQQLHGLAVNTNEQLFTPDSNGGQDPDNIHQHSRDDMLALGQHSRQFIQTIQRLEALDINSTLPSLPKFVVVGDQSAGKSSIIEAVCNITLPRKQGTCTRCPFQITTSAKRHDESWSCTISLLQKYIYEPTTKSRVTVDRWLQQQAEPIEFAVVKDRSQLEEMLKRAQIAILNPSQHPSTFATVPYTPDQRPQVQFSPNLICLDIKGPGLPELSFYDLPGSINVVEDEKDQHLVPFVEKLVKSYLGDRKALILLACSADQDIENSTTFRFIRDCEAENRCVGVLTKPDLLPASRLEHVVRLLQGKTFRLRESWHITKQLSQAELESGLTHDDARRLEHAFFSDGIWATHLSDYSNKFGIANLQDAISRKLTDHIISELPEITERVKDRIGVVDGKLSQFKEKDVHPMMTVLTVIRDICTLVNSHIDGSIAVVKFRPIYRSHERSLRKHLKELEPALDAKTPGYKCPLEPIQLDDSDNEEVATPTPTPARSKRKARELPDRTTATPASQRSNKRAKTETPTAPTFSDLKKVFNLHEVEQEFRLHASQGLPEQPSSVVRDLLIKQTLTGWGNVVDKFLEQIDDVVKEMVLCIAQQQLQKYSGTALYQSMLDVLQQYISELLTKQSQEVRALLAREQHKPLTFAPLGPHRSAKSAASRTARTEQRVREYFEVQESNGGKVPTEQERKNKAADEAFVQKFLGLDPYQFALTQLEDPMAYYEIAFSRFTDMVALHLERELLFAIEGNLQDEVITRLNVKDPQVCEDLLLEDPQRERERQELLAEKGRLHQAMLELNELPRLRSE